MQRRHLVMCISRAGSLVQPSSASTKRLAMTSRVLRASAAAGMLAALGTTSEAHKSAFLSEFSTSAPDDGLTIADEDDDEDGVPRLPSPSMDEDLATLPAAGSPEALAWLDGKILSARAEMAGCSGDPHGAGLYDRQWAPTPSRRIGSFVVMQFNVLAEGLSASPNATPPFPEGAQPSAWGGLTAVPCKEVSLAWRLRRWRVLEEILRHSPNLVAMEEVDHFEDFWRPVMAAAGFEGRWLVKRNSPCLRLGYHSDGTAVFWKTDMFEPAGDNTCVGTRFKEADENWANQGLITVDLMHQASGEVLRFAATHLKAKEGEENERKRELHMSQIVHALQTDSPPEHTVLCGDFNTDPFDVEGAHDARAVPLLLSNTQLVHAYPLPKDGSSGEYTTWKRRGHRERRHWIDYIFHSPGLHVASLLQAPSPEDIGPERLPSCRYPSDHVAIAAELVFSKPGL